MNGNDAREYSESIGQTGEGWWRQIAWAHNQGVPKALGISTREWAERYHGYLKLATPDRREAVKELAREGLSNRQIADVIGVGEATVRRDGAPNDAPLDKQPGPTGHSAPNDAIEGRARIIKSAEDLITSSSKIGE